MWCQLCGVINVSLTWCHLRSLQISHETRCARDFRRDTMLISILVIYIYNFLDLLNRCTQNMKSIRGKIGKSSVLKGLTLKLNTIQCGVNIKIFYCRILQ